MHIELVSHAWAGPNAQYAKLLKYQLQSLIDYPPSVVDITMSLVYWKRDEAVARVASEFGWFTDIGSNDSADFLELTMPRRRVLNRAIGRNLRAKETEADWVFFVDCDECFGPGCLDSLAAIKPEHPLYFAQTVNISRDHATGDRYIKAPELMPIDPADFVSKRERKAIGGNQLVPGDVARQHGYCPQPRYQRPAPADCSTVIGFGADAAFRRQLGTPGTPVDVPNLFRLRHSVTGDDRAERAGIAQPADISRNIRRDF